MTAPPPTSEQWRSNTTSAEIASRLRGARRVIIVTHGKPDGDAAGSTLALARSLRLRGADAEVWYIGPVPTWMCGGPHKSVTGDTPHRILAQGVSGRMMDGTELDPGPEPDVIAVLDTGSWSQLAELRGYLEPRAERAVLVDHHLHGQPAVAAMRLIDPRAAAATELVAPICVDLLDCQSAGRLPVQVAEPLYLGLATDTGWFRHSNVTAGALRLAADLLEAGVVHTRLYELIEQNGTAARLRLMCRALASLRIECGGRVAIMTLRRADLAAVSAERTDTTGFIDLPMTIAHVRVSAIVTEEKDDEGGKPVTKISLRSKPGDDAVDVNQVASQLGGGGHARAAGAKMDMPVDQAIQRLIQVLSP